MTTAAIRKNKRLKLPTPEETGQILFLRSRALSHTEIGKHFGKALSPTVIKRALEEKELWLEDGVMKGVAGLHQQELDGVDFHAKYANNPYGKRASKKQC